MYCKLSSLAFLLSAAAVPGLAASAGEKKAPPRPAPRSADAPLAGAGVGVKYDLSAATLDVPLAVIETAGLARQLSPVTSGIPLPRTALVTDFSKLRVVDSAGKVVPAQFRVLDAWRAVEGQPARWVLVDFQASAAARGKPVYHLRAGVAEAPPATPLTIEDGADKVTVNTGPLKFTVSKKAFNLFDEVWLDGEEVLAGTAQSGAVATSYAWKEEGLNADVEHFGAAKPPTKVVIEEQGPARVCILAEGVHWAPGAGGAKCGLYNYKVRIYAYAGQPMVRVYYSLANSRVARDLVCYPLKSLSLRLPLVFKGPGTLRALASEKGDKVVEAPSADGAVFRQDVVSEKDPPKFKLTAGGKDAGSGEWAPGAADLSGKDFGLTVAVKNFVRMCPKAISAKGSELSIDLFPADKEIFFLTPGTRRVHEMVLVFHKGAAKDEDLRLASAEANNPLFAFADPTYVAQTEAWAVGLPVQSKMPAEGPSRYWKVGEGCLWGGKHFVWFMEWNGGGRHWNHCSVFTPTVVLRDWDSFQKCEYAVHWQMDIGLPYQFDFPTDFSPLDPKCLADKENLNFFEFLGRYNSSLDAAGMKEFHGMTYRAFPEHPSGIIAPAAPGVDKKGKPGVPNMFARSGRPDNGHMGIISLDQYYHLTGNPFAREAVEMLGVAARGSLRYYVCENHRIRVENDNADDPSYKLIDRYPGWPLYQLAELYAITGNPLLVKEGLVQVKGFRNTMRVVPVGIMAKIEDFDHSGYGRQGVKGEHPKVKPTGVAAANAAFQNAIVLTAIAHYARDTMDRDALDTLLGGSDGLAFFAAEREKGKLDGWKYVWSDYWHPLYDVKNDHGGTGAASMPMRMIAVAYYFTGREDYLALLKELYDLNKGEITNHEMSGAYAPVLTPRADPTRPTAVKDLAGAALGGGKVELTWTAPAADGKDRPVAWYQVKHSADPIIERVKGPGEENGWPWKIEQPPATAKDYEARAAEFMHQFGRPFWSATNAKGEPKPQAPGAKEKFTVEGLKPGTYYFALKSWSNVPSVSDLSNVVKVEVE